MIKTYIILGGKNPPIHMTNDKIFEINYLDKE